MWTLRSASFEHGYPIPQQHTGDGEDASPPLEWTAPPPGTKELALVVDDPDAPTADPWVHWILYKIPAALAALPGAIAPVPRTLNPSGMLQGKNTWGSIGWRGPSPPPGHGPHRYRFRLQALDAPLPERAGLSMREFTTAIEAHVLAETELVGTYTR